MCAVPQSPKQQSFACSKMFGGIKDSRLEAKSCLDITDHLQRDTLWRFLSTLSLWVQTHNRVRDEIGMLGLQYMPYISIICSPQAGLLAPLSPIRVCVVRADGLCCRSSPSRHHLLPSSLWHPHTHSYLPGYRSKAQTHTHARRADDLLTVHRAAVQRCIVCSVTSFLKWIINKAECI